MPDPKAVLLDVGGVLLLPDHDRMRGALARAGFTPTIDLDRAHYAGAAQLTAERLADLEWPQYWTFYLDAYLTTCGVPDDMREAAHEHLDSEFAVPAAWTRRAPGAQAGLRALLGAGVRLGVVSNADGTVEQQLRDLEILQVGPGAGVEVGVVIDSTTVGISKPDPRIFELALAAMGIAAEDAWYVGDTTGFDVAGARAAGLRPIMMDPFELHLDEDYDRIVSLSQLAAQISD